VLFCVCFAATLPASAQVSKGFQVKAVCLWRLAQFVTWPTNAFENTNSPIVIAVLGENPFGDLLNAAVSGETAHGRRLAVEYYRSVSDIKSCHILFVSASEAGQVKKIFAELAGRSILTVADFEDFARSKGGSVCFLTRQNKIKLQINLKAVTAARLGLDPRLLRAAEVIDNE
ncbi:MAG: YfiR family protein, partial [Verrucomicrobia bacterium]|nr:YfiR family protein [Verrucomicrobiota bacterium]